MIYLDNGATSFPKPKPVREAVEAAMLRCGNPGRGNYEAAQEAGERVYACREGAGLLFNCSPEQVVMTGSCTQGINMAVRSLFSPGDRVVTTGFEHNAVTRTLYGLGMETVMAGRRLFDWEDSLREFEKALDGGAKGAVFTHVSNVFGYILPVEAMAELCRSRGLPFILDAAQSAGSERIDFQKLGADFIAMPGHKGLLGPMGTGLLLCRQPGKPFLFGGTGTQSRESAMPDFLPEQLEAGTLNVPGIAGLAAGIRLVRQLDPVKIGEREKIQGRAAAKGLKELGMQVFSGEHQGGTISFIPPCDCEEMARRLGRHNIAVRAGLHCAPAAHESAGTLNTGTVRVSFGFSTDCSETQGLLQAVSKECR